MLYRGYFYNLKDERYQVEMITERNSGATRNLQLGVPPFVTEMEESDDNLFKPCKYQSATLKVVTTAATDYQFDVYATAPNSTIVKLIAPDASVKWVGFATPNLYNIGFTEINEELDIELIDALSILQYYKYETQEKTIRSFAEILLTNILPKCELYKHLYVSRQIVRETDDEEHLTSDIPVLNDLYISEMNFFDEKSENQTDNDVAWTCQEVLEQICQYIGVTLVGDGEDLWMISYDDLKFKNYTKYNIGETAYTEVQITAPTHLIQQSDYMGGENNISMLSVYNKVSVKDSFYTFDSVIPSIYDNLQNITKSYDYALQDATSANNGMYGIIMPAATGNSKRDTNKNMIALLDKVYDPTDERYTTPNAIFVKYFKSPNYQTFAYQVSSSTSSHFSKLVPVDITDLNYTETKSYRGAVICKFDVQKLDNDASNIIIVDPETGRIVDTTLPFDKWLALNDVSSVNFTNYLAFLNPNDEHHIQNESAFKFPFFETIPSNISSFFGGDNCYLLIKGNYIWHYFTQDPYPIPVGEDIDITEGRYAIDSDDAYMLAKLQWGDEYWNGSGWTSGETTFQIPYFKEGTDIEDRRADHVIFDAIGFRNTVSWRFGLSEKGYCIPCPHIMTGALKITLYKPTDPNYHSARTGDDVGRHYKHSVVFLKDFDIKAVVGDPSYSDVNDTDTKFEATIDSAQDAVSEMDEIEFKICTNDNKAPNYSAVCYKENDEFHYLTKMFAPLYGDNMRPEEILIQKLCLHYGSPKIKLQLQLDNTVKPYQIFKNNWVGGQKNFVVDCQSIDYYNNVTTITLVEKYII